MKLIQKISMDFAFHGIPPRVYGKQDDSQSRIVQIDLFNQGEAWPVPSDAVLMVRYRTPKGAIGLYDTLPDGSTPFEVSENTVLVQLVDQIFAAAGAVECELRIISAGAGISTWTFLVDVERGASGDENISSDYINVLTELTERAETAAEKAEASAKSVDAENLMKKETYDATGDVENEGGIKGYVEKEIGCERIGQRNLTGTSSSATVITAFCTGYRVGKIAFVNINAIIQLTKLYPTLDIKFEGLPKAGIEAYDTGLAVFTETQVSGQDAKIPVTRETARVNTMEGDVGLSIYLDGGELGKKYGVAITVVYGVE